MSERGAEQAGANGSRCGGRDTLVTNFLASAADAWSLVLDWPFAPVLPKVTVVDEPFCARPGVGH